MKTKLLFALIFIIGVVTRFLYLEQIPTFISQDELGYVVNAKSLAVSGTDVTGTWNPWSLTPVTPWLAELPTQLMAPFFLLPIPVTVAARLPFVILSLIVPFALAGISYEFFKSKSAQNWTFVIAMFNPWIWQLGRMSFDPYFSFSFYIIGAYLLIKLSGWKRLISLLPFFVGFYTYQGHKVVFLFWIFFFMVFALRISLSKLSNFKQTFKKLLNKKNWPIFTVGILSFVLFVFYVFVQLPTHSSKNRTSNFFTPGHPDIALQVNSEISLSLNSRLTSTFINKYSVWSGELFHKFMNTYSFETLFLEGQPSNSIFSLWNYGYFHIIDALLIFAGILFLFLRKRYKFLILLCFGLLTFVFPYLIADGEAYIFRSSLNIPLLILVGGLGAGYIQKILPKYFKLFLPFLYILSICYFAFLYFIRYPVLSSERQYFNQKIAIDYSQRILNSDTNQNIIFFDPESRNLAWYYIIYADLFDSIPASKIQEEIKNNTYTFNNVRIISGCEPHNPETFSEIIISENNNRICGEDELSILGEPPESSRREYTSPQLQLNAVKDSGIVYRIFNDQLCAGTGLSHFIHIDELEKFDLESMDNQTFCQTWVSRSK